jgi:cytochrome P450
MFLSGIALYAPTSIILDQVEIVTDGLSRIAGADTTAIAMSAIIHPLLCQPTALQRLVSELDRTCASGNLTSPIRYTDAAKLPYLSACIKEGMRLHPSVGLTLPRYVPKGGTVLAGKYIPEGTTVGINANVYHYDTSIFGDDAAEFKHERWLDDTSARLEKHLLYFGAGTRTCLGKNVSLLLSRVDIRKYG